MEIGQQSVNDPEWIGRINKYVGIAFEGLQRSTGLGGAAFEDPHHGGSDRNDTFRRFDALGGFG